MATTNDGAGKFKQRACVLFCMITTCFTAMADVDYSSVSSNETFAPISAVSAVQCVNITILDDNALGDDLTFTVELSTSDPGVVFMNNVTIITITDDDG
jgi:hypothetical protein